VSIRCFPDKEDIFPSAIGQRGGIDDGFRHGLHRERPVAVADAVDKAVHRDDTNAKPGRIGLGEFRM